MRCVHMHTVNPRILTHGAVTEKLTNFQRYDCRIFKNSPLFDTTNEICRRYTMSYLRVLHGQYPRVYGIINKVQLNKNKKFHGITYFRTLKTLNLNCLI